MAARRRILKKSAELSLPAQSNIAAGPFKSSDDLRNLTMEQINERYETFKLMSQFEVPEN